MTLTCRVMTPDATYFDGAVDFVVVPSAAGELAFYPSHAPLIAQLGHGVLRVNAGDQTESIAVFGGFVKIKDNTVLVLAGGAEKASEIDENEARAELDKAKKALEDKRPPKASQAEFELLEESLVRAEALYAAASGTMTPIRAHPQTEQ